MTSPKEMATPTAANPKTTNPKDTSAASQRNTIRHILQQQGHLTTLEARANGIMHPAMRVCELRKQGFNIITSWIYQTDNAGVRHRVGVYSMDRAPMPEGGVENA